MTDLTPYTTVLGVSALVLLIMQTAKQFLPDRFLTYIPYASIILAIIVSFVAAFGLGMLDNSMHISQIIFTGLLGGLGAIGTYEATLNKVSAPNNNPPPAPK